MIERAVSTADLSFEFTSGSPRQQEDLVLLTILDTDGNTSANMICDYLFPAFSKRVDLSTIHTLLGCLVEKEYLMVRSIVAKPEIGGKRRELFFITEKGYRVISDSIDRKLKIFLSIQ